MQGGTGESVADLVERLVSALLALPAMMAASDRAEFTRHLARSAGGPTEIRHSDLARVHAFAIIHACREQPSGLAALADTARHFSPSHPATSRIADLAHALSVLHVTEAHDRVVVERWPAATGELRRHQVVPQVWGNVPSANPNFTGREDMLALLDKQLQTGPRAAILPYVLQGMGGAGKSQIAIEYAYRHTADYDVIWWISAEQPAQVLSAMTGLAQALELDVSTEANSAVPAVLDALRMGRPYANWLLIFDNAEDIPAVRELFPTGGTGKILVTSRNAEWNRVARTLSVDVFRREESKELLCRRTPELSDLEADRLADVLGDLPLAIEQAASWRAASGMAVAEYLSLIEQKRIELLDVTPSPDYPVSVAAAWNVSLDRLAEQNTVALQLLQVCAFFAPEPVSRDLLRRPRAFPMAAERQRGDV